MKKVFITAAFITTIIAVRMILSVAISEQIAEAFCNVSISFLFFYAICRISKNKAKTNN